MRHAYLEMGGGQKERIGGSNAFDDHRASFGLHCGYRLARNATARVTAQHVLGCSRRRGVRGPIGCGLKDAGPPHLLTVSWIQGYEVGPSDTTALRIRRALESRFKRVLQTWAPSLDWSLLVRGKLAAVVAYGDESEDLLCGVVLCSAQSTPAPG